MENRGKGERIGKRVEGKVWKGKEGRHLLLCIFLHKILQCESKKVAPLKLLAIFSLRLSIFP